MHIDKYERGWIIAVSITLSVFMAALIAGAVIFGVRLPESDGFVNPNRLDDSIFANPGVRNVGGNQWEVVMIAQRWNFIPGEITVPEGAEVTFFVTSRDITHGFIIERHNINFEVVPGHIARATITFDEPGEYRFICHEYCGQLHHRMHGVITVEEE